MLTEKKLNISYTGSGKVVSQDIGEGQTAEPGQVITVKLE